MLQKSVDQRSYLAMVQPLPPMEVEDEPQQRSFRFSFIYSFCRRLLSQAAADCTQEFCNVSRGRCGLQGCGLVTARTVDILLANCVQCGTSAEAKQILASSDSCGVERTSAMRCQLLRSLGSERRLREAMEVAEACPEQPTCLRNTLLDICVKCGDLRAAERVMAEAKAAGGADVVTHNTIIKAYLGSGDTRRARKAVEAMRADGLAPNCVTFNELIDASVKAGDEDTWGLIEEMRACGLEPNQVTCSILLKSIQRSSKASDVEQASAWLRRAKEVDGVVPFHANGH